MKYVSDIEIISLKNVFRDQRNSSFKKQQPATIMNLSTSRLVQVSLSSQLRPEKISR